MSESEFKDELNESAAVPGPGIVGPDGEQPVKPIHLVSPAHRRRQRKAESQRRERARRRYLMARTAVQFAPDGPVSAQRDAIAHAIEAGLISIDPGDAAVPSLETVRQLVDRWRSGARSIHDYIDAPRSGRPNLELDARLVEIIKAQAGAQRARSVASVHRRVQKKAKALGLAEPTYAQVRIVYARVGPAAVRSASRHGVLAATMDALPHSTVPVSRPHDVWTVDEFTLPNWAKVYDPKLDRWVSVRPDVVVIQDYYSRANLAHWIADPKWADDEPTTDADAPHEHDAGIDPENARRRRGVAGGLGLVELKGAFNAAACPEVAFAAERRFAGFLPNRVRWDKSRAHTSFGDALDEIGVEIDELPPYRPINRGIVERHIGTLKFWCDELPGHRDHVIPLDRLPKQLQALDRSMAQDSKRHRQLRPIRVEDLPTIPTLRRMLERLVHSYNTRHAHRGIEGKTPRTMYEEGMAEAAALKDVPRPGRDLLMLDEERTTRVTRDGVVHRVGKIGHRFSFEAGGVWLSIGTEVAYRPDPLLRGLFATVLGKPVFLEPLAEWASRQKPRTVAHQHEAIAQQVAEQADAARLAADIVAVATTALENAADQVKQAMHDTDLDAAPFPPTAPPEVEVPAMPTDDDLGLGEPLPPPPLESPDSRAQQADPAA